MAEEPSRSDSSLSTLGDTLSEKADPLMQDANDADALAHPTAPRQAVGEEEEEYYEGHEVGDLEMGHSLTRADTAAWVTKHPSRIPDEGSQPPSPRQPRPRIFKLTFVEP